MNNSLHNSSQSRGRVADRDYFALHLPLVPAFRALLRGVECRLMAGVAMPPPVLDVGCGDGLFAKVLADGEWFAGVDREAASVREAKARRAHAHALVASGTHLPFADAAFSTVVSNCVLEHIPDVDAVVREVNRVLRPGGRFALTVPSHLFADMLWGSTFFRCLGLERLGAGYGAWFNRHSAHFHCDSPERWQERLSLAGFRVERWEYYLSSKAVQALDLAHYYGVPSLLFRKWFGRWVLGQSPWNYAFPEWWLRKHYQEPRPEQGGYIFIVAVKSGELSSGQ